MDIIRKSNDNGSEERFSIRKLQSLILPSNQCKKEINGIKIYNYKGILDGEIFKIIPDPIYDSWLNTYINGLKIMKLVIWVE
jgi:hypothetical protein